jgi:hypothetical protein
VPQVASSKVNQEATTVDAAEMRSTVSAELGAAVAQETLLATASAVVARTALLEPVVFCWWSAEAP